MAQVFPPPPSWSISAEFPFYQITGDVDEILLRAEWRGAAELDASKALGIDFPLRDYPECPAEKSAPLILWGRQPPLGGITI